MSAAFTGMMKWFHGFDFVPNYLWSGALLSFAKIFIVAMMNRGCISFICRDIYNCDDEQRKHNSWNHLKKSCVHELGLINENLYSPSTLNVTLRLCNHRICHASIPFSQIDTNHIQNISCLHYLIYNFSPYLLHI